MPPSPQVLSVDCAKVPYPLMAGNILDIDFPAVSSRV